MRAARAFLALLLIATAAATAAAPAATQGPAPYKKDLGPYLVVSELLSWQDAARDRPVPVKIYSPATGKGPFPVIVFSHGLGGSREGYEYLGRQWASQGYVAVHVEHLGSDTFLYVDAGPLGMLTARYLGELSLHAGDRVSLVPDPARIHRFDQSGNAIRG